MSQRILVLEPFGGGSHAALYRGWQEYSQHELTILELPATHWKWRTRHSSLTLAKQADELARLGAEFDLVFCSDMLNLPEWRGLADRTWSSTATIAYFHENQFTYPLSGGQQRDYHYAYNNVLTAVAAQQVWFNTAFHREQFASAARSWLRRMPDYAHIDQLDEAIASSTVCPPGINPPADFRHTTRAAARVPTIGWVARWEHDKRPDRFAEAVKRLIARGLSFNLVLLGQQFRSRPESLDRLLSLAGPRVVHCGYAESQEDYWRLLSQIDVVVSTADHEFFGIGIVEAVFAGAQPLLPNRLAYPEVFQLESRPDRSDLFYDGSVEHLCDRLTGLLHRIATGRRGGGHADLVSDFLWSQLASRYDIAALRVVNSKS